ncbi:hypothetical protein BH10ACI3_BH10ACI3_19450 [soil metagenome]
MIETISKNLAVLRIVWSLFWLVSVAGIGVSQGTISSSSERHDAEKAWEALIRAKGGRENLYKVNSMLTQFSDVTLLNVFPSSRWRFTHWLDMRLFLEIYDERTTTRVWVGKGGVERVDKKDFNEESVFDQIPFLLETNWYKPTPIRVKREKMGKKSVDVIEVLMAKTHLQFVYDPEEMLVTEVRFLFDDGTPYQKYRLSNYVDVNGIKMPTAFNIGTTSSNFEGLRSKNMPISFAFNVDYNPKIFEPPFIATTTDAWKRKP